MMLSSITSSQATQSSTSASFTDQTLQHRKRAFESSNDTVVVEPKRPPWQQCQPSLTTLETLRLRSLYGRQVFGRRIHVSGRSILHHYKCYSDQVYYFYFPDFVSCTPFVCDYAHAANEGNLLAVPDEEGRVSVIRTDKNNGVSQGLNYHYSFYAHTDAIMDVKWSRDDTMLLTSGADKRLRIMDVESKGCLGTFIGHRSLIKSANWHPTNPHLFVSACTDGSYHIWDTRFRQLGTSTEEKYASGEYIEGVDLDSYPMYGPIKYVPDAHMEPNSKAKKPRSIPIITANRTVTTALFYPNAEDKVITSGSFDGTVKLWDCRAGRTPSPLQTTSFQQNGGRKGISDMKIDHSGTRLFSLCTDNSVHMRYLLDLTTPAKRYISPGFNASLFTLKLSISHDDQFLLTGSNNNHVYAWDIDGDTTQAHIFESHSDTVTGVSWHKSRNDQFASCGDDFKVRIWKT